MIESFYVEDLVTGVKDAGDAFQLYEKSKQRMAEGGFKLRKWLTNDKALRDRIEQNENPSNAKGKNDDEETFAKIALGTGSEIKKGCHKVLGLPWDLESDSIAVSFEKLVERARGMRPTKRNLLSLLAGLFDPLGVISPMIVPMKMLFQTLCCEKRHWDDELEGKSKGKIEDWVGDLSKTKGISIGRCVYENPKQRVLECQLHGFGDASSTLRLTAL